MVADVRKAAEVFHATLRDAAQQAAKGEPPSDRLWFFRDARWRCLEASEKGLQAEDVGLGEEEISTLAPSQIKKLEPEQLAIWISAAPDPQRTALALEAIHVALVQPVIARLSSVRLAEDAADELC